MIKRTVLAATAVIALTPNAQAQIIASERGTVSQVVDGTTITIDYGRPKTRGRLLFGGEVWWGKVWTPGANWATTLTADKPITLNGHDVAAGTYSVWFHVQEAGWTAILDPQPRRFHLFGPEESPEQIRFPIEPQPGAHTEVLTWSFPSFSATGATLRMAWGDTTATFEVGVNPSRDMTVTADFAERFVGLYHLTLQAPLGDGTTAVDFEISYDGQHLVAEWENAPNPNLLYFWLAPTGAGMFWPVELESNHDEVLGLVTDVVLEFTPLEGEADRFEFRALGDQLWGVGERAQ